MANRNFASGGKIYSMHVMPVLVDTTFLIGSAGSVSSVVGPLIRSISHMSTGVYKISLVNNFNRLFQAQGSATSPSSGLSGILAIEIQNNPNPSVQNLADPSLTIKCLDAAGALADPASGASISCLMYLSNSSVVIAGE